MTLPDRTTNPRSHPAPPIYLGVNVLRNIQVAVMACLEKDPARRPSMEHIARCYAESASLFQPPV